MSKRRDQRLKKKSSDSVNSETKVKAQIKKEMLNEPKEMTATSSNAASELPSATSEAICTLRESTSSNTLCHQIKTLYQKSQQSLIKNQRKKQIIVRYLAKKKVQPDPRPALQVELLLLRYENQTALNLLEAYRRLYGEMGLQQALSLVDPSFPPIL